jgi:DNA-directed RNA polymerase II subunit RPB2
LTYATELYVDVSMKKLEKLDGDREKIIEQMDKKRVFIGRVPVMVGSKFCHLKEMTNDERVKKSRDCVFDQGGYFIINGNEKVIVAQERMSTNQVLVFKKKQPSKYSCISEVRSQAQNSTLPP